jgi:3-isopropylmalate dehydrogenase
LKSYRIIILPGDGIGPELVDGTRAVLDVLQQRFAEFRLDYDFRKAGAQNYLETGQTISDETLKGELEKY